MNARWGWPLAAALLVTAWVAGGWRGAVLALTLIVFWLLLQFSQAMRVMRRAARSPVGSVDSAVMLQAKLRRGMSLLQLVAAARSLGRQTAEAPETWAWTDAGGVTLSVEMAGARVRRWQLLRPTPGSAQPRS